MAEIILYPQAESKGKTYVKWVFYGLIAFLAIFFPFFGKDLRYYLAPIFKGIFNTIFDVVGMFCVFGGIIYILLGIFGLFGRRFSFGKIILGGILLWVGCWMTGFVIDFFGVTFGGEGSSLSSKGYH